MAKASEEGLGPKWAVVPLLMMMMCTVFWLGDIREWNHVVDLAIDGRITAKWISTRWDGGGMDWMNLVQDRDRWLALVNVVMNRKVSPIEVNFTSWGHVTFWGRSQLHGTCSWPI